MNKNWKSGDNQSTWTPTKRFKVMIKTWKKNIFSNKKLENIKENQVELKNIITEILKYNGLPWSLRWLRICLQCSIPGFDPWVRKIPWRRGWLPPPIFLPGEFHGQRNLMDYSLWSHKELDMTKRLTLLLSLFRRN